MPRKKYKVVDVVPTKLTLMYVIDDLCIGGAQKVLLYNIRALNKREYKIIVISLFNTVGLTAEIKKAGAEVICLRMANKFDLKAFLRLTRLIKKNEVLVVHTHLHIANFFGRLAAKLAGTKVILSTLHNYYGLSNENSYFRKVYYQMIDRITYPISTKIITVSDDLKKSYISKSKVSSKNIITIYNSIDLKDFFFQMGGQQIREELNINIGSPILGSIQLMRGCKPQDSIIYSMPKIIDKFPDLKLLLVGDGTEKKKLIKLVKKLKIERSVYFLGFRKDICEILAAIDIFVTCPLYEAFGMAILEAMAMQKPVIASKVGGISEVVKENETAILVNPYDHNQLSMAIIDLLENKVKREQMGINGRKRAETLFSAEIIGGKIEALYEQLLSEARS